MKKFAFLLILLMGVLSISNAQIISQYIETDSGITPKGLEIWNNTSSVLDFSVNPLIIEKGVNGGEPEEDFSLSEGTLAVDAVIVIGTPELQATAETNGAVFYEKAFTFNGDDALVIKYGGTITDIFGQIGVDPGSAWTGNGVSTKNQNIELNEDINIGDIDGWDDPSLRFSTVSTTPSAANGDAGFGISPANASNNVAPIISNVTQFPASVTPSDEVHVTASVEDTDGSIEEVKLYWGNAMDNITNGIEMTPTYEDFENYRTSSPIPAQAANTTVFYYVTAKDDDNAITETDIFEYLVQTAEFADIPYNHSFDEWPDKWFTYSVYGASQTWHQANYGGNNFAKMNGYDVNIGNAVYNEDWLLSPIFNLTTQQNEKLSFESATKYDGPALQLLYSTDYPGTGNPTNYTWVDMTDQAEWSTQDFQWVLSGDIDISNINENHVVFAFKYLTSDDGAATWEIDNFKITSNESTSEITVTSPNGGESWVQGTTHEITWQSTNVNGNVKITLLGAQTHIIAENAENTGVYTWAIPTDQAVAQDYKIKVSSIDDTAIFDESDAPFSIIAPQLPGELVITEIMYNPPESGTDSLEYIEIYNVGEDMVNLQGYYFQEGVEFTFPDYELASHQYVVVCKNEMAFTSFFGGNALQWTDGSLKNKGEKIVLASPGGEIIDEVEYFDSEPWPTEPDGSGPSLTLCDPLSDNTLAENWTASTEEVGTNADGNMVYGSPNAGCDNLVVLIANFETENTSITPNTPINFTDLSTGNPTSWSWNFEGATPETSTEQNPSNITYSQVGTYNVTLTVTNESGFNSITKEGYISIGLAPVADFNANVTTIVEGQNVIFFDNSENEPTAWTWQFEGGEPMTSSLPNPTITYAQEGTYSVSLQATNDFGTNEVIKENYIHVGPDGIEVVPFDKKKVFIYPNPTSDNIMLITKVGNGQLIISNILGEHVLVQKIMDKKTKINVSNFSKGIYTVTLIHEKDHKKYMGKLMIK